MKEFPTEGDELKKLLKFARKIPLNFGYNPGTTDDADQFLALHKRKAPEVLGRIALHDGAGTKSAFGTLSVNGNIVALHCERELPQLAKRVKKLLRLNKMNLNVQILDKSGTVIDSVIEDIEPDPALDDDTDNTETTEDDAAESTSMPAAEPAAAAPAAAAPSAGGQDARDLAVRLRSLQSGLQAAPGPAAAKLERAFTAAVGLVRAGDLEKAASMVAMIETTLARVAPGATTDAAS